MIDNILIKKISDSIHNSDPNAEAWLFGSRARGDHRKDSDWDILILIKENKVTNEIEDKFREDLYDLELEEGNVISTFIYPRDHWNNALAYSPLYKRIVDEGMKL